MRKTTSTNFENQLKINGECGMAYTLTIIGGRWKPSILFQLLNNKRLRFNEIKKRLSGISERILASKLKELEENDLITRIVYQEIPPRVEYELTEKGYSLEEILNTMSAWGEHNRDKT